MSQVVDDVRARTLFVDDKKSFIDYLRKRSDAHKLVHTRFCNSLREARFAIAQQGFHRVVVDRIFEGEEEDGIDFLAGVRASLVRADLILLTGKQVSSQGRDRLSSIGARYLDKASLTAEVLDQLISGAPHIEVPRMLPEDVPDPGELALEVQGLRAQNAGLQEVLDTLVGDVIAELQGLAEQPRGRMIIGDQAYSARQLEEHVRNRTELGLDLIRLHSEMYRRLRGAVRHR